ncbi:MAG TPA: hypothetical protein VF400_12105 [Anaeromyxobacteraceae bacterium]
MNALLATIVLLAAGEPATKPETPTQLAVRLASRQFPEAKWRVGDARVADFTFDGKPDVALLGADRKTLLVVVVEGPVTRQSRVLSLRFAAQVDAPDGICGIPEAVQANTEPPSVRCQAGQADCERERQAVADGADAGGLGLVLIHTKATGYCEAFHVHFDGSGLVWWREPTVREEASGAHGS